MAEKICGCNIYAAAQTYENSMCSDSSRRKFVKSLAVAGLGSLAGASLSAGDLFAKPAMAAGRIDVHHHMIPPVFLKMMEQKSGVPFPQQWTPQTSIDVMDAAGVGVAVLSTAFLPVGDSLSDGTPRANSLARQNNEFGAECVRDHPTRFGLFASLPLGDPDASLKEIEYSLDTLKTDGIGLWNFYINKWPGDPLFAPIFDELNRRKAVVFFHPITGNCCGSLPITLMIDTETAGTINSLMVSGTFSRCPDIKFIFSHAGGSITVLWPRMTDVVPPAVKAMVPKGIEYEMRKLYFDTAKANTASIIDALKGTVPVSQILYGSDAPVQKYSLTNPGLEGYAAKGGFTGDEWKAVQRGNAERLFPRFKA